MKFPELDSMLPAQAKQALTDFFFKKLESSSLNIYMNPTYKLENALENYRNSKMNWGSLMIVASCFDAAMEKFEKEYPVHFDANAQSYYREGFKK